jgi:hypothetical protein
MKRCTDMENGPESKAILSKLFWDKLQQAKPSECWLWKGTIASNGYGKLHFNGRQLQAHRVSYYLHHGAIPEQLLVLHRCDVRLCCNPAHLWTGSHRDNTRDCVDKGRWNPRRKLTESDVLRIRHLSLGGLTSSEIAERFMIGSSCIRNILAGITWKKVRPW